MKNKLNQAKFKYHDKKVLDYFKHGWQPRLSHLGIQV